MKTRAIVLGVLAAGMLPATAQADFGHVVQRGESLTSIAATDGLTVAALAGANGISPDTELTIGEIVEIPPITQSTAVESSSASTDSTGPTYTSASTAYVVQWGDTLSAIAARAGTTVGQLAAANGLNPDNLLLAGTVLQLSGAASSTGTTQFVSDTAPTSTAGGPPYPTPETVSASEIAGIAAANGVPAPLAQAVGWQESGWNNDEVSSANAVGVMQVVPSTWSWINRYLTPSDPLGSASASENVRGGVLLLHDLLSLTGGSSAEAAAGYYQGLSSVKANGMYPDTKQYVADVLALEQRFGG